MKNDVLFISEEIYDRISHISCYFQFNFFFASSFSEEDSVFPPYFFLSVFFAVACFRVSCHLFTVLIQSKKAFCCRTRAVSLVNLNKVI